MVIVSLMITAADISLKQNFPRLARTKRPTVWSVKFAEFRWIVHKGGTSGINRNMKSTTEINILKDISLPQCLALQITLSFH